MPAMSRKSFLDALARRATAPVFGTGTSIVCRELMDRVGVAFPEAHVDAEKMATLAAAGHTVLGLDVVMPLFSVCHEAAAMGCQVNWGRDDLMPECGPPIFRDSSDIRIPSDLLTRPGCAVPLRAIPLLKEQLGDRAAVCGKVFGPWTQSYYYFGIENFLMLSIEDPEETRRILEKLVPVTEAFAEAQVRAGADCILLGDHATRDLCSPQAYEQFVMPLHQRLARRIGVPVILHICGDTSDRIGMIARTGLCGFHWDTKTAAPAVVRKLAGPELVLMGGISNRKLLQGTPDQLTADAATAIAAGINIVGPECAVPLTTPLANLLAITAGRK
jgi:[methyl-Co(III) methanol-specific corrinoid protein]:coenzyme M methyltransferase